MYGLNPDLLPLLVQQKMPFGRFEGRLLADLPISYLEWFARKGFPEGKLGMLLQTVHVIKSNGLDDILYELKKTLQKAMSTKHTFTSSVQLFEDNLWFYHFLVPKDVAAYFLSLPSTRRVLCKINGYAAFNCALMPDGLGDYFINLSQKIRAELHLKEHQEISVTLKADTSEYGMPMPEELQEMLYQDPEGNEAFLALTPGKQRNLIYIVNTVKSAEIKMRRAFVIVRHLRMHDKLDFKQLNAELKEANQAAKNTGG